MRWSVLLLVVVVVGAINPQMVAAEELHPPELVATLFPADGFLPAGTTDHPVYRFQVIAQEVDESGRVKTKGDSIVVKVMEATLVEPGQTRAISSPGEREWRLEGTVTIREDGFVMYRVALIRKGERVTSTSAGMTLNEK